MTLRAQGEGENLEKAFAVLRDDPNDVLNNTVDVGIHYNTSRPRALVGNGSIEGGSLTERSAPEFGSTR